MSRFQRVRFTPIHEACVDGDVAEVKRLLSEGEDVNEITIAEQTLLHVAAEWGHTEMCVLLLNAGADIEAQDDWGDTPLYRASLTGAVNGQMDTALYLVNQGASLTHQNNRGDTPLDAARYEGNEEDVLALLNARRAYEAEQSKKHLLEGLEYQFMPTQKEERQQVRRRM